FDTPEYQDEMGRKRDRRSVGAMVKAVEEAVLPEFGLAADDEGLKAMTAKIWLYGCCDPEIYGLAEDVARLSCVRLSGHLPWVAPSPKDNAVASAPVQKSHQRAATRRRRASDRRQ
ncbi:unnamed protein product, partial [Polarella glacialis]